MVQATALGIIRNTDLLEYFRFNFIGSVLPFALGTHSCPETLFPDGKYGGSCLYSFYCMLL